MSLTTAQLQALQADIAADPVLAAVPHSADGAYAVAQAYNLNAVPDFTVWKTNVSLTAIGDAMDASELAGLTALNSDRLRTIATYSAAGVNPSLPDRRAAFDDIFSGAGGVNTRARLLALWKRLARRIEKLYATGTGSTAVPAQLTFEGSISMQDVQDAWNV